MRAALHTPLTSCLSLILGLCLPITSFADTAVNTGEIETIKVIGQHIRLSLEKEQALTPGGVTLVDSAELYERNISSMADMLRYVPGVWASSSAGGDAMFFSSRGSNLDATN